MWPSLEDDWGLEEGAGPGAGIEAFGPVAPCWSS